MKVEQLIKELSNFPKGSDVCIFDYRKNLSDQADEEGSGLGITEDITVIHVDGKPPFIGLFFNNEDYDLDGNPDPGSRLYSTIEQQLKS